MSLLDVCLEVLVAIAHELSLKKAIAHGLPVEDAQAQIRNVKAYHSVLSERRWSERQFFKHQPQMLH